MRDSQGGVGYWKLWKVGRTPL